MTLDPSLKVIAPVREWDLGMRPDEIAYAKKHGVPVPVTTEAPYSIDDNLWGPRHRGGRSRGSLERAAGGYLDHDR